MKYLTLIRTMALLHQYQREVKTAVHHGQPVEYIEVTLADVEIANKLAHQVLGRSLDELPPQTRRLLMLLDGYVTERCAKDARQRRNFRFTRREVREASGWGNSQLKVHLDRLVELEYLLAHRERARASCTSWPMTARGRTAPPSSAGLIDPTQLRDLAAAGQQYDFSLPGVDGSLSGRFRGAFGPLSGGFRVSEIDDSPSEVASFDGAEPIRAENATTDLSRT